VLFYCAVQSPLGQRLLNQIGLDPDDPASFVFIKDGVALLRSAGALAVAQEFHQPWPLLSRLGALIPRALRDGLYDWIATNRIRWFGAREVCLVASPEQKARFLIS
jgi:predicted DCC family thiol-disulfide oxidoreductase YuxK